MMKKLTKVVTIVLTLVVMVGCATTTNAENVTTNNNNTTTIDTTLLSHCYDEEQFKGKVRIEQMFVTDVEYTDNDTYNVVTLEDTTGNVWMYEGIDLYLYDDVVVLMTDNNTPTDVTDDCIVHFWVSIEQLT